MSSALYNNVVGIVSSYIGDAKGPGVVERQLKHCSGDADTFGPDDLRKILVNIFGAASLYMNEPEKKEEMKRKLQTLIG